MSTLEYRDGSTLEKFEPLPPQEGYQPAPQQWNQPSFPQQQVSPQYYPGPPVQQSTNNVVVIQQPGNNTYAPVRPNDYLARSLLAYLCCCWPIAIVALIHSCQVSNRYNAGDYAGAMDSSKKARYWSKVAIIVGTVLIFVWVGLAMAIYVIKVVVAVVEENDPSY